MIISIFTGNRLLITYRVTMENDINTKEITDPVRKIRITKGPHEGWHNVYYSEKVFREYYSKEEVPIIYRPYWTCKKAGDWIFTDDGYIVQVLDYRELIPSFYRNRVKRNPNSPNPKNSVIVIRTAARLCKVYTDKNGNLNASKFYGSAIKLTDGHLTENYNPMGKYITEKKKHFITLIVAGKSPAQAYMEVYKRNYQDAKNKAYNLLMKDEKMLKEISRRMGTNLIDDLNQTGMTSEYVLNEMKKMIDNKQTASATKAELIKFLIKMHYQLEMLSGKATDKNKIRAGYTVVGDADENRNNLKKQLAEKGD